MWFTLARDLGMSVARCMSEVSSLEFTYWQALYLTEGEERQFAAKKKL